MPGARMRRGYRLLTITGEIVASRTLAISLFGSLTPLNLIVSTLFTQPVLNLEQKAEKTLIPFPRATQLSGPRNDFGRRESLLLNLESWIIASPHDAHVLLRNQFYLRFAHVTLQFRLMEGMLRSVPEFLKIQQNLARPRLRPARCKDSKTAWEQHRLGEAASLTAGPKFVKG